jgi:hydrogenase expression/formation protein HypE
MNMTGKDAAVSLAHGAGGGESHAFIEEVFLTGSAGSGVLREDAALIADGTLAMTIDGFVVDPPDFPGGDIGKLAICGTVNDLAVRGAVPRWIAASWIIPEGTRMHDVRRYADSLTRTAADAGVQIVAGDTKVVPARDMAGPSVTTCGVGEIRHPSSIGAVAPGDVLLVSGSLGAHTAALIARREGLFIDDLPPSDCALLHDVAFDAFRAGAHFARDATRGGVAAVLWELARAAGAHVRVDRAACPVHPAVAELCGLIGLDPLYLLLAAAPSVAHDVLAALHRNPRAHDAEIIGHVLPPASPDSEPSVEAITEGRTLPLSSAGLPFPRLC